MDLSDLVPGNKKLAIVDLDGTIGKLNVDWPACRIDMHAFVSKEFGGLNISDTYRVDKMEATVSDEYGDEGLKRLLPLRQKFEANAVEGSILYPEPVELVKALNSRGLRQAILSNNLKHTAVEFLKHHDLEGFFDYVIGLEDINKPKPSARGCRMIRDHYRFPVSEIIFIGDNPASDGEAAKKLGIDYMNLEFNPKTNLVSRVYVERVPYNGESK